MPGARPSPHQLRHRIRGREHTLGTFIKTPTSHATEIMGLVGFDFVIVDQEHAPFDRWSIELACLGARASGTAAIVRVSEPTPASILSVLDVGANGVMIPHVDTPEKARAMAAACRYRGGNRGFANTTRAGAFGGASFADHMTQQDNDVTCVAMIEDEGALPHIPAIAAVEGIDAFFIGRGDLTAALGEDGMKAAVDVIATGARAAGMPVMVLVSSPADARAMRDLGASAFVFSNDQSLMKAAATQAVRDYGTASHW